MICRLRLLVILLFSLCLVLPSHAVTDEAQDLELGKQFLYCGVVTMKVIEWTGEENVNKEAEERSKSAYTRILIQTAALIPRHQFNDEYRAAQRRLAAELRAKAAERDSNPGAVGAFLSQQYMACRKLESEKGKEVFARGVEAMNEPTNPPLQ